MKLYLGSKLKEARSQVPYHKMLLPALQAVVRYLRYRALPKVDGGTCICVVNGPSFTEDFRRHQTALEKFTVMSGNRFVYDERFSSVQPAHYILLDPAYFRRWLTNPELLDIQHKVLEQINARTHWPMNVFFPFYPEQIQLERCFPNTNVRLRMCSMWPIATGWGRNVLYRTNLVMPPPRNVLVAMIYLSINMGYEEIYILGADHDDFKSINVDRDNRVYYEMQHFNEGSRPARSAVPVSEFLYRSYCNFLAYELLQDYADSRKVRVYNASSHSLIDAFERVDSIPRNH